MTDPEKIKVELSKSREVRPYTELWHGANVLEKQAIEDPAGSTWKFMSSLILTAFAWEAYLNQLGAAIIEDGARVSPETALRGRFSLCRMSESGRKCSFRNG